MILIVQIDIVSEFIFCIVDSPPMSIGETCLLLLWRRSVTGMTCICRWSIDVGWTSTWVKIVNEWLAAGLYSK